MSFNILAMTPLSDAAFVLLFLASLFIIWECNKHSNKLDLKGANAVESWSRLRLSFCLLLLDIIPPAHNPAWGSQAAIPGVCTAIGEVVWHNFAFAFSLAGYAVCSSPGWVVLSARHVYGDLASKIAGRLTESGEERLVDGAARSDAAPAAASPPSPAGPVDIIDASARLCLSLRRAPEVAAYVSQLEAELATLRQEAINRESHWDTKLAVEEAEHKETKRQLRDAEDEIGACKDRFESYETFYDQVARANTVGGLPRQVVAKVRQLVRAGCDEFSVEKLRGVAAGAVTKEVVAAPPSPVVFSEENTEKEALGDGGLDSAAKAAYQATIAGLENALKESKAKVEELEAPLQNFQILQEECRRQTALAFGWQHKAGELQQHNIALHDSLTAGRAGVVKMEADHKVELDQTRGAASEADSRLQEASRANSETKSKLAEASKTNSELVAWVEELGQANAKLFEQLDEAKAKAQAQAKAQEGGLVNTVREEHAKELHKVQQASNAARMRHQNDMKQAKERLDRATSEHYREFQSMKDRLEKGIDMAKRDGQNQATSLQQQFDKLLKDFTSREPHVFLYWKWYEVNVIGKPSTDVESKKQAFANLPMHCQAFQDHWMKELYPPGAPPAAATGNPPVPSTAGQPTPHTAPTTVPGLSSLPTSLGPAGSSLGAPRRNMKRGAGEAGLNVPSTQPRPRTEDP